MTSKPKNTNSVRVIVFSTFLIFGLIAPGYFHFFCTLKGFQFDYQQVAIAGWIFALTVSISLFAAPKKLYSASILGALAATTLFVHLALESTVKEFLADFSGVYSEESLFSKTSLPDNFSQQDLSWVTLSLPSNWTRHTHASSNLPYFTGPEEPKPRPEIRLTCIETSQVNIGELIFRKLSHSTGRNGPGFRCSRDTNSKACLFTLQNPNHGNRIWEYYLTKNSSPIIINLKFIPNGRFNPEQVKQIASTVMFPKNLQSIPACIIPTDWLNYQ